MNQATIDKISEISQRLGEIQRRVSELVKENSSLKTVLSTTENHLSDALRSLEKLPHLEQENAQFRAERANLANQVEVMLRGIDHLEKTLDLSPSIGVEG